LFPFHLIVPAAPALQVVAELPIFIPPFTSSFSVAPVWLIATFQFERIRILSVLLVQNIISQFSLLVRLTPVPSKFTKYPSFTVFAEILFVIRNVEGLAPPQMCASDTGAIHPSQSIQPVVSIRPIVFPPAAKRRELFAGRYIPVSGSETKV
jgi:hypothetical protein